MTGDSGDKSAGEFRIKDLPPYALGPIAAAVNSARLAGKDVIDFSQVNPEIPPPQAAVDKLVQALLLSHNHRYSASQGISKLRQAFASLYQKEWQVRLDPDEEVVVTLGIKEGLAHLLLACAAPGETVILPTPSYPIHSAAICIAGARVLGVPLFSSFEEGKAERFILHGESSFFPRLEEVFASTWPRPRWMVCSFPHNPTGTTVEPSFFERLVQFSLSQSVYLIHDFAYAGLSFRDYRAPSLLSLPEARTRCVEFLSVSKSLSMPGWRIACCAGNPSLIAALKRIKSYLDFGIFQPLQIGAVEALRGFTETSREISERYEARRDELVRGLSELGFGLQSPRAGVFVWAKLPEQFQREGSAEFANRLLRDLSVAVLPGTGFEPHEAGCLRFSLIESESRIRAGLERMQTFCRETQKS